MAFVEMDDAPRISWRDHFHEVEVYVTARRVAELHGYESCHHCLLQANSRMVREKTERLKALRLAKEAADKERAG